MGGAWLASVDSPTLSEGIMKYFLSVLIPFGFVHPKPQGFDFTNNCRGGAICNTDIDIQKTIQIFRGGTMFGSTGGRGGGGEFGQGGGAPSGGAGGGRITIPARPSLEGDCNYDCSGWPYLKITQGRNLVFDPLFLFSYFFDLVILVLFTLFFFLQNPLISILDS